VIKIRLFDIALFLALFGAVIGVIDSVSLFPGSEIPIEDSSFSSTDIEKMQSISGADSGDSGGLIAMTTAAWSITMIMISALGKVVWIYDFIINVFSNTTYNIAPVAAIIQTGIWLIYGIGILQLLTKSSIQHYQ